MQTIEYDKTTKQITLNSYSDGCVPRKLVTTEKLGGLPYSYVA